MGIRQIIIILVGVCFLALLIVVVKELRKGFNNRMTGIEKKAFPSLMTIPTEDDVKENLVDNSEVLANAISKKYTANTPVQIDSSEIGVTDEEIMESIQNLRPSGCLKPQHKAKQSLPKL